MSHLHSDSVSAASSFVSKVTNGLSFLPRPFRISLKSAEMRLEQPHDLLSFGGHMQNTIQSGMLAHFIKVFFYQKRVEQYRVTQNTDSTIHIAIHMPLLAAIYFNGTQIAV